MRLEPTENEPLLRTYLRKYVLNFKTKVLYFAYNDKKEIVPGPGVRCSNTSSSTFVRIIVVLHSNGTFDLVVEQ